MPDCHRQRRPRELRKRVNSRVGEHDTRGSVWHRWDPHIHAPGTVLNDQFHGDWDGYLNAIESSNPPIRALGITDYCSIETYLEVVNYKHAGRLANVDLIFPNVELRYDVGTYKGRAINVHLLVCSDDKDHVESLRRFLSSLTFHYQGENYRCERADLVQLGKTFDPASTDDDAAFRQGVQQFKVSRDMLREQWKNSPWAQENILIGVAVGNHDGTAGLQKDPQFAAVRREIERFARIIFSGQENQRRFWLGQGSVTLEVLKRDWNGQKPCIHGSDAHEVVRVGKPTEDRYTWIKGDLTFEALRLSCFEPETRVAIGATHPAGALPSEAITSVQLTDAPWITNGPVALNPGLVGIIGARGSGKTALADIIAAGAYALRGHVSDRSFVRRAEEHLENSTAQLRWADGDETSCRIKAVEDDEFLGDPRVQYLSQQFVDVLCSAEGITDRLLGEIKRVVFDAHPPEDRMGATTFDELLDIRTTRAKTMRASYETALQETISQALIEWQRQSGLRALKNRRDELAAAVEKDKRERTKFIGKGGDERVKQMDVVTRSIEVVRLRVQQENRKLQSLEGLRDEVASVRKSSAPLRLNQLRQTFAEAALGPEEWKAFELHFAGAVDDILRTRIKEAEDSIKVLAGPKPGEPTAPPDGQPVPNQSFIPVGAELEQQTLSLLQAESNRLRALLGIDARNASMVKRISDKISKDESTLAQLNREVEAAEKSTERIGELNVALQSAYSGIFDSIVEEELQLASLYAPLKSQLAAEQGALQKLSFNVRRWVNLADWVQRGEKLFDLRVAGSFQGRGALLEAAKAELLAPWQRGSSQQIAEAVNEFRKKHQEGMRAQTTADKKEPAAFRQWWTEVSRWLWGSSHVSATYSIQYEGADIEQLSPGTRGIVLLLLYLAIDKNDDRPLIIDQPEENLDPKSIYDDLVAHFRRAKQRRQIIVVTHNANVIVNADADQVIVAECGQHQPGRLPAISYTSGGLENPAIRKQVCDILEGGEAAFRERAKRLRIGT